MAGTVDRELAEWLIVALVLFALLVEFILHKLEHWVAHRHPQMQSVLRNLYRELMILGAVSFGFILYIFIEEPNGDIKMTFEVAHVFIFLFAVFHTFVVMVTIGISLRLSKRWKILERMDLSKYLEKKEAYRKITDRMDRKSSLWWRYVAWWFPKPGRFFKYWKLHEIMAFHDTRFQFIYYRNLQPDFHFASFLRKIKSATFIELVEIHWTHFLFFLGFVLLDIARVASGVNFGSNFEPAFLIAESIFNILFTALLAAKIRRVYWKMTKNPATYYDAVDRRAVEEERMIAEEEMRIEKEHGLRTSLDFDRPRTKESIDKPRAAHHKKAHGSGLHTPQPVYANLAYVPGGHGSGTTTPRGEREDDIGSRHSLDVHKTEAGRVSARTSFDKPGRYVPGFPRDSSAVTLDVPPVSGRSVDLRRSLELAMALPTTEIAERTANSKSIPVRGSGDDMAYVDLPTPGDREDRGASSSSFEADLGKMERILSDRSRKRAEAIRRIKQRKQPTASIVKNAQDLEAAQQMSPSKEYPSWLLKVLPRLGRVASPAEKLFWFGSHKFFFWCVEWVLFFVTINLSATLAKIGFAIKEAKSPSDKAAKKAVKMVVRAAASAASATGAKTAVEKDNLPLLFVALAVALVAMFFVLMRIAGIMKKYIFVLNNANMLPESMAIQAIQTIGLKSLLNGDMYGHKEDRSYDTDTEEPESMQMRRNLSSFLGTEAQKGYMPGVSRSPVKEALSPTSNIV